MCRNTHLYNTSYHFLVILSHLNKRVLQVERYLRSLSRAMSALCGSLNNLSTSRFCTDDSVACSLCNPRYTLYAAGREDLLEMIEHSELMNTQPEQRSLTMLLSTLSYQRQIASFGVNVIPYNGTWNQIGRRHHCDSVLQSKFSLNEWQIDLAQFSTGCKLFAISLGWLLGLLFLLLFSILCKKLLVQTITDTYFSKQWAAVRTHWGSIRVPPQKCRP